MYDCFDAKTSTKWCMLTLLYLLPALCFLL